METSKKINCVLKTALSFLGLNEGDGSHMRIVNLYNTLSPLPRGYHLQDEDPWCTAFIAAIGVACGLQNTLLPECSAEKMLDLYRQRGLLYDPPQLDPRAGDLIFFDWENDGQADHVALIYSVKNGRILLVEGNAGDAVVLRALSMEERNQIRAWVRPQY